MVAGEEDWADCKHVTIQSSFDVTLFDLDDIVFLHGLLWHFRDVCREAVREERESGVMSGNLPLPAPPILSLSRITLTLSFFFFLLYLRFVNLADKEFDKTQQLFKQLETLGAPPSRVPHPANSLVHVKVFFFDACRVVSCVEGTLGQRTTAIVERAAANFGWTRRVSESQGGEGAGRGRDCESVADARGSVPTCIVLELIMC